ncbi:hypothetical protein KIN20_017893 [Parelaphostrongylus tenuis]|uniref:Uncharacterized protein n=1 Tax=Parelaphostrongylus tenuis TaxID=148309 RepID=A0AAD5MIM6_PARTN|nr:hypothetical protein KIN20_017893 [Parelaphostrongylus tenuis]
MTLSGVVAAIGKKKNEALKNVKFYRRQLLSLYYIAVTGSDADNLVFTHQNALQMLTLQPISASLRADPGPAQRRYPSRSRRSRKSGLEEGDGRRKPEEHRKNDK